MRFKKENIFNIISIVGVVTSSAVSAYSAVKIYKKVKEIEEHTKQEIVKECIIDSIPPILSISITLYCIYNSNKITKKRINELCFLYNSLLNFNKKYMSKNIIENGEESHSKILNSIYIEHAKDSNITFSTFSENYKIVDKAKANLSKALFYEPITDIYFESDLLSVLEAEYHLNRNYSLAGYASLNEFLYFLGLAKNSLYDNLVWDVCSGIYWIDFTNELKYMDDGTEYYVINSIYQPELNNEE